ncbi:MAG: hypothetical protein KatS3mg008_0855 [Acidimicrobiales bacterium]|nr:MAG: hypothetical protein KatS3mg008_0855 [Acidimicrobiales bacterium]
MAEVLFRHQLQARGVTGVRVSSAGLLEGGFPPEPEVIQVLAEMGVEPPALHVSRQISREMIEDADLVLTMERGHLREAVVMVPSAFEKVFCLREFVARAGRVGARRVEETPHEYLARVGAGRGTADLLGSSEEDEVPDPMGRGMREFRRVAVMLADASRAVVRSMWPDDRESIGRWSSPRDTSGEE